MAAILSWPQCVNSLAPGIWSVLVQVINCLLPDGQKLLPEPVSTYNIMWHTLEDKFMVNA